MESSVEITKWLQEGANAGDPIRGPLYVAVFVIGGLLSVFFQPGVVI